MILLNGTIKIVQEMHHPRAQLTLDLRAEGDRHRRPVDGEVYARSRGWTLSGTEKERFLDISKGAGHLIRDALHGEREAYKKEVAKSAKERVLDADLPYWERSSSLNFLLREAKEGR